VFPAALRAGRHAQAGLSIIEVMVGLVVALLVGIAAAGSAAVYTAMQRQGISVGGSQLNANTAMSALRDDIAAAGLGFFGDRQYLCTTLNLSVGTAIISDGAAFTPVALTAETAGDRVDVISATQVISGANILLNGSSDGSSAQLRSLLPVSVGQAVLLAPPTPGDPCLVRSVTAVTDATDDAPLQLSFAVSGANSSNNQKTFTTNPGFADKGRVALLGGLRWSRYRLVGTELQLQRPLGGDPVTLVRNVIGFRAQYGMAAAASGSTALETWESPAGTFASMNATLLPRVRALRIGLVTRSVQAEKPNPATGLCEATTTLPTLFGLTLSADVSNWQCYRYRTAIVVVPLRNIVMGLTP
jgi:type IV pilus assembly protein PilW